MSPFVLAFVLVVVAPQCTLPTGDRDPGEPITETAASSHSAVIRPGCGRAGALDRSIRGVSPGFEHQESIARVLRGGAPSPLSALQGAGGDSWLAADKIKHLVLSYAVTGFAYAGLRIADVPDGSSLSAAAVVAFAAGIGKELSDSRRGRGFSRRDLAWNVLGIGAGMVVMSQTR